ncbi:MAG: hypothetical protein VX293_12135 [Candidatus Latescibacterota bacterium]|nr:hypothetical protein [Candidatus Latescibacterota bacterium]
MTTATRLAHHSRWMISPVHDPFFFIATPVLTFAILVPLRAVWVAVALCYIWSYWHLFMQHYGVMRIYDAKEKIFAKRDVHLDGLLTCFAFLTVIFYSAEYMHRIFDTLLNQL